MALPKSSTINEMNMEMLEVWKDYLELCSVFLNKAEEIRANEELSVNLELVRASIIDLSINITNFKDLLSSNAPNTTTTIHSVPVTEISSADRKKLVALFFLFLMKIDKESILNGKPPESQITPTSITRTAFSKDNPDLD